MVSSRRRCRARSPPPRCPEQARSYADAARRGIAARFDGVELHGANGYLISQFLSTSANRRTDRYGGTIANRIPFAVEAVEATVDAIGARRTGTRLSPGIGLWGAEETDVPEMYAALLAEDDQATWYEGGDNGYLDYPTHTRAA